MEQFDIIRLLKANAAFAQTIFVILSQRDGVIDKLKGRLVGAHAYLTRPFKTDQILAVIRTFLGNTFPERTVSQGEHKIASSEATARSHVSAGAIPPPQHSL